MFVIHFITIQLNFFNFNLSSLRLLLLIIILQLIYLIL